MAIERKYRISFDGADEQINKLSKLEQQLTEVNQSLSENQKALKKSKGTNKDAADKVALLKEQKKRLADQTRKTSREVQTQDKLLKANSKTIEGMRLKVSRLTQQWAKAEVGSKKFKELENQLDQTTRELLQYERAVGKNQRNVGNYQSALSGLKTSFVAVGAAVTGATMLISKFSAQGMKVFDIVTGFEDRSASLASVLGTTREQIKALTEDAKRLGSATSFTASEVVQLQTEFSKLGFTESEILNATEATLALAAATKSDLSTAAEVAGATVRGFGLNANETQRVVDVMAKSFSSSALDMSKFSTAMASVAPVAKTANVSIEEASSFLSVLADSGLDASTAGTSLRNILLTVAKEGISLEQAFQKINTSSNKNATALDLFGKRGATAAIVLADNTEKAEEMAIAYSKAGGAAQKMADEQLSTLTGRFKLLNSAVEGLVLELNDSFGASGAGSTFVDRLAESAQGLIDVEKETKGVSMAIKGLALTFRAWLKLFEIILTPLRLTVTKGVIPLTNHLNDKLAPAVDSIGLKFIRARNKIADFVNGVTQSGLISGLVDIKEIDKIPEVIGGAGDVAAEEARAMMSKVVDAMNENGGAEGASDIISTIVGDPELVSKMMDAVAEDVQRLFEFTAAQRKAFLEEFANADEDGTPVKIIDIFLSPEEEELLNEQMDRSVTAAENAEERIRLARERSRQQRRQDVIDEANVTKARIEMAQQVFAAMAGLVSENAKAQKAFALLQIGLDTAKGIASATAMGAASGPFPANMAAIAAGVATVLTNIAAAKKALGGTKERGGILEEVFAAGGVLKGARHSQGGIQMFGKGGYFGEAEGGEAIINRRSTALFKPLLSQINQAGGGRRFAMGGTLAAPQLPTGALSALSVGGDSFNMDGLADKIIEGVNDKRVILVESDVTETQGKVQAQESEISF